MIFSEATFRILALSAGAPGSPLIANRLREELSGFHLWDQLAKDAEEHGLEPLLRAHLHEAGIPVPGPVTDRLRVRSLQHAHAHAVRMKVLADLLPILEDGGIALLALKGVALAHLAYSDPSLRPMRDVDLLVPTALAGRAAALLRERGFSPVGAPLPARYHHMRGLSTTVDGATITIEIHRELIRATPFVAPQTYVDLCGRALSFERAGLRLRTLGKEDMLWHVYAHAFVINVLRPEIRLVSLADLVNMTEAWVDDLDWDRVRRCYGRLYRALPFLHHLVPWSTRVLAALRAEPGAARRAVRPVSSSVKWSGALSRDTVWLPDWWFRVRYGVRDSSDWLWYRLLGHPLRLAAAATQTAAHRAARRFVCEPRLG